MSKIPYLIKIGLRFWVIESTSYALERHNFKTTILDPEDLNTKY